MIGLEVELTSFAFLFCSATKMPSLDLNLNSFEKEFIQGNFSAFNQVGVQLIDSHFIIFVKRKVLRQNYKI